MRRVIKINNEELKQYLDGSIKYWRVKRKEAKDQDSLLIATCYIDAFQSVRTSVFGELLS